MYECPQTGGRGAARAPSIYGNRSKNKKLNASLPPRLRSRPRRIMFSLLSSILLSKYAAGEHHDLHDYHPFIFCLASFLEVLIATIFRC